MDIISGLYYNISRICKPFLKAFLGVKTLNKSLHNFHRVFHRKKLGVYKVDNRAQIIPGAASFRPL